MNQDFLHWLWRKVFKITQVIHTDCDLENSNKTTACGAGFITSPLVKYLLDIKGIYVVSTIIFYIFSTKNHY